MLYRKILKDAWMISWHNKYLWFFGLFAALAGNSGGYKILSDAFNLNINRPFFPTLGRFAETGIFSSDILTNIAGIMKEDLLSFIIILLVYLVIIILFCFIVWLVVVSQAAIVNNSARLLAKSSRRSQTAGNKHFKDGVAAGVKNFWPVLGLNLINKLIIAFISFIVSLLTILAYIQSGGLLIYLLYLAIFIIFAPAAIILSFIIKYAIVYVVVKGRSLAQAIEDGWRLFVENWLVSIEMAFVLFFITFAVSLGWFFAAFILMIPFLFLAFIFYKLSLLAAFSLIMIISLIIILSSLAIVGAILAAFQISVWTNLFLELVGRGGTSKIARVVSGWTGGKK